MYCNHVVRLHWNSQALGLWGIKAWHEEKNVSCTVAIDFLCKKNRGSHLSLTTFPFPCLPRENDLEGGRTALWVDKTALATAQLHHPGTKESPLISLEWFSFIAYCLSLQIAFRMNVPAGTHIEDTGFPSTSRDADILPIYETSFKLTINGGYIWRLRKRKLHCIRSSALWLRQWIRWGIQAGVLSYWA